MKVLVFGAGVIGTTYAWQMSEAGIDVSLLVRKQRFVRYSHSGVTITCTDLRGKKEEFTKTVFRPRTVDRLDPKSPYDLIIVAVKNFQLNDVVPYIASYSGNAHIMFLGNLWSGQLALIEKHLPKGRYFFGYPGMAGGGRTDNSINCYLLKNSNTLLGEPNGSISPRLRSVCGLLSQAGLQPRTTAGIIPLLRAHYIWTGATFGAVVKAGGARAYAGSSKFIGQSARAMMEGFRVCKKMGISAPKIFPFTLFFLPLPVMAYLLKRSYSPEMQAMIEARLRHGFDEMQKIYSDILGEAKKFAIQLPYWKSFEKPIQEAAAKRDVF